MCASWFKESVRVCGVIVCVSMSVSVCVFVRWYRCVCVWMRVKSKQQSVSKGERDKCKKHIKGNIFVCV